MAKNLVENVAVMTEDVTANTLVDYFDNGTSLVLVVHGFVTPLVGATRGPGGRWVVLEWLDAAGSPVTQVFDPSALLSVAALWG